MNLLKFQADWLDDAHNKAPDEQATVADFYCYISEKNITRNLHDRDIHESVTVSLYPLAHGIVHDWWSIFGGRDREFSLVDYRGGFVVPDMRFSFDGTFFEISAKQFDYHNPEVSFLDSSSVVLSRNIVETKLLKLVSDVIERLEAKCVRQSGLAMRWERIEASRNDPDESEFCEAAGALGLDPYRISDDEVKLIDRAAGIFEGEPLAEFLAGARGRNLGHLLAWIETVERRPGYQSRVRGLRDLARAAEQAAPAREYDRGWSVGYRRARAMRKLLDLTTDKRVRTYKELATILGASKSFRMARAVNDIKAYRSDRDDGIHIHIRDHGSSPGAKAGQLFSFARAVGDSVCFPEQARAPINDLGSAYRQAAGRAFAAEFLAPIDEIESMRRDGKDIDAIADEFCVSTVVIDLQVQNIERNRASR